MSASCCGFDRRNVVIVVLSLMVVVAVTGWVRETTKPSLPPQQIEMVEVLVAAQDLTTGTSFTRDSVDKLTEYKAIPKSELPPDAKFIRSKFELIGKRLSKATHQGEFFNAVNAKTNLIFEPGLDIMTVSMKGEHIVPGSRVDILTTFVIGNSREAFTLLPDVEVLSVYSEEDGLVHRISPGRTSVAFFVTEKQARLMSLANQRNCLLELLLRHPDTPKREFDYHKTLALLKQLAPEPEQPQPQLEVAPAPRVKM